MPIVILRHLSAFCINLIAVLTGKSPQQISYARAFDNPGSSPHGNARGIDNIFSCMQLNTKK
jgi:hypothetical protein